MESYIEYQFIISKQNHKGKLLESLKIFKLLK